MMTKLIALLFGICLCGCQPDFNKVDHIDLKAWEHDSLKSFNSFKKPRKFINGIKVCQDEFAKCRKGEIFYEKVLNKINVPISDFNRLMSNMEDLRIIEYQRHNNYSLWITGGAFGDMRGYLFDHSKTPQEKIEPFRLNDQYYIYVGKKIKDNIFHFSGS